MTDRDWRPSDPATRVVPESDIVAQLQLRCFAYETAEGKDTAALAANGLERLIALGLPFARDGGQRRFDPYEPDHFMRWASRRFDEPLWMEGVVATCRRLTREFADSTRAAWRFEVSFERELGAIAPPGRTLRTQLPLPPTDEVQRDVEVRASVEPGARALEPVDGRIDVRLEAPPNDQPPPRLSVELTLRNAWRGAEVDPGDVEPFREPDAVDAPFLAFAEGPIQVTDAIRALARTLGESARTPWDALQSFWSFVFERLTIGGIHPHLLPKGDPLSALLVLGRADCYWGSALLAALCRACRIPARLVSGNFVYSATSALHTWLEVRIPPYGWLPCDLLSWVLSDGERRQRHESERFLGRLDPRLVVERFPRRTFLIGPPLPPAVYLLQRPAHPGTEDAFHDLASGALVYRDRVRVRRCERA